ncbi:hypothetical protein [Streptomyces sennicomposti]|nr:hypothetical protein [Streptomyces sennicomposti]MBY8868082.1 hypothetical protein [Streptomyces sennicomposti]
MIVLPPATGAVLGREETCTRLEETVTADRPESGTKAGDAMAYSAGLR